VEVLAVSHETRIGPHADGHEGITRRSPLESGVTLTAHANPLTVLDPGRDLDVERAGLEQSALACALATRLLEHSADAATLGARALADELPEDAP
jgi:hypothetical protein